MKKLKTKSESQTLSNHPLLSILIVLLIWILISRSLSLTAQLRTLRPSAIVSFPICHLLFAFAPRTSDFALSGTIQFFSGSTRALACSDWRPRRSERDQTNSPNREHVQKWPKHLPRPEGEGWAEGNSASD